MLDVAGLHGVDVLEPGQPIKPEDLAGCCERQGIEIERGDAVLIRSGWPSHWNDPERYLGARDGAPGPDEAAAEWLASKGIRLTGSETVAYEWIPPGRGHSLLPVHRVMLVENGIHIVENLRLTQLAEEGVSEFLFVLTPLKVMGATGVPVRPVAVVR
jgi:kynurenine formamidase